jgi:hypothetical protein
MEEWDGSLVVFGVEMTRETWRMQVTWVGSWWSKLRGRMVIGWGRGVTFLVWLHGGISD